MQRLHDSGAYELGNIRKGYPRDNAKTAQAGRRNRDSKRCAAELQAKLDAAMHLDSAPDARDLRIERTLYDPGLPSSSSARYTFRR
jgi:hypothetical protein